MGWWSEHILGGDIPLDIIAFISDAIGVYSLCDQDMMGMKMPISPENLSEAEKALIRERLNIIKLEDLVDLIDRQMHESRPHIYQVLGFLVLTVGANAPQEFKDEVIAACKNEDLSAWTDPSTRRQVLDALAGATERYDGKPVRFSHSQGLLETIIERTNPDNL